MKVRVLKLSGAIGFRAVGTEFNLDNDAAKRLIAQGVVESAAPPKGQAKPKPPKGQAKRKKAK